MGNRHHPTLKAACEVWGATPEAIAFVLRQCDRLPDWLHIPLGALVGALAVSGWVKGQWFHELPVAERAEILGWWQRRGGPGGDLVRLIQSLTLFGHEP